jgi:hypothetical protein
MRKIPFILFAIGMVACSIPQQEQVDEPDCDCDKVVQVTTFNVVGTPQNPAVNYHSVYTTINECTQIQKQKTFDTTNQSLIPQINQCR